MVRLLVWFGMCVVGSPGCASFDVTWQSDSDAAASADSTTASDAPTQQADAPPAPIDAPLPPPFCDPADESLIACYNFDGQNGQDRSQYGHDLVLVSTSFRAGISGSGLLVDATSMVVAQDSATLDVDAVTMEMWIRPDELPRVNRMGLLDNDGQYALFLYPDGEIHCRITVALPYTHEFTANTWTHVACTNDGAQLTLWIDGVAVATRTAPPPATDGTNGMTVGMNNPDGDNFVGLIDNVRVWATARSAEQLCAAAGVNCQSP